MQTFLPYPSFHKSANCLDNRRLGKQRVECLQILNTLFLGTISNRCSHCHKIYKRGLMSCPHCDYNGFDIIKTPWYNHPAVQMWKGYEWALFDYTADMCCEWQERGFKDSVRTKIKGIMIKFPYAQNTPPWLGNEKFHASHRSNLLRKNPSYYGVYGWKEPDNLPYYWPTKQT